MYKSDVIWIFKSLVSRLINKMFFEKFDNQLFAAIFLA